ncbi:MAG: YebC/PmpR family DNA-binding transcriptional regulator [Candidatus Uhrbacteria bacterium]
MARHSHFHNIQGVKGKADAIRANTFSKVAKNITVSVKEGGTDPAFNFKLRLAIDSAKAVNMPKDNIERAIARGAGSSEGEIIDEVIYEGFGPGGIAILIRCMTDNHNRTVGEIKNIVSKNGGSIGNQGSVMWMFEKKTVIGFADPSVVKDRDTFELSMIDAGAEDISFSDEEIRIIGEVKDFKKIVEATEALGLKPDGAGIEFIAKTTTKIEDPVIQKQIEEFIEIVEANDDVDAVFTNEE